MKVDQSPAFAMQGPQTGMLNQLPHGWRVQTPLPFTVERVAPGEVVATDVTFGMYGVGPTEHEAVTDLQSSLVEYCELIESADEQELPGRSRYLEWLGQHIVRSEVAGDAAA